VPASPDVGARYAAQVARLVDEAEIDLLRLLATTLRTGIGDEGWIESRLAQVQAIRRRAVLTATRLDLTMAEHVLAAVRQAYNAGSALALTDLEQLGVKPAVTHDPLATARTMAQQALDQVHSAIELAPRILLSAYEQAVAAGSLEVLGGKVTRLQASQHVLDRLLAAGIRGYVDSAGRSWSLDTYVEMAVRTTTGQAAVQGHVDTLAASGVDLIVVSDAPRECPLCRPWEGKVLSTSGATTGTVELRPSVVDGTTVKVTVAGTLEQARAAGLQHPNCRHNVSAYLPGATRVTPAAAEPGGYEASQRQREIERTIRAWKRRQAIALDDAAAARASGKVRDWQAILRDHVEANDLKRLSYREQIGQAH
jgi:hypothetical protein